LDSQQNIIREVPPNFAPATGKELNIIKHRIVRIFQDTDFTKKTTTTPSPTTTPTTTTTTTIKTTPTSTTTTQTKNPSGYYPWNYYNKKDFYNDYRPKYYDDLEAEDEDDDENEDESSYDETILDELSSLRKRKRRMVEGKANTKELITQRTRALIKKRDII